MGPAPMPCELVNMLKKRKLVSFADFRRVPV
jgi:hypothetical protein